MTEVIPEFGQAIPGAEYRMRPGGYVVLRNEAGEVAVVVARLGTFLPGGGQEGHETAEAAAVRETLEECGLVVRIGAVIGVADELAPGEDGRTHFRKRCTFFEATVAGRNDDVVPEHVALWLRPEEAAARLAHASQRWAVRTACSGWTGSRRRA